MAYGYDHDGEREQWLADDLEGKHECPGFFACRCPDCQGIPLCRVCDGELEAPERIGGGAHRAFCLECGVEHRQERGRPYRALVSNAME